MPVEKLKEKKKEKKKKNKTSKFKNWSPCLYWINYLLFLINFFGVTISIRIKAM